MVLNLDRFCLCLELSYSAERVKSSFHDENTQIQIVAGGTCTCTEDTDRESGCTGSGTRIETLEYWWNHIFLTVWVWLLLSQLVALKEMPTHQKKTYKRYLWQEGYRQGCVRSARLGLRATLAVNDILGYDNRSTTISWNTQDIMLGNPAYGWNTNAPSFMINFFIMHVFQSKCIPNHIGRAS